MGSEDSDAFSAGKAAGIGGGGCGRPEGAPGAGGGGGASARAPAGGGADGAGCAAPTAVETVNPMPNSPEMARLMRRSSPQRFIFNSATPSGRSKQPGDEKLPKVA